MIIPIELGTPSPDSRLPSGLAKLSDNEVVLVELQGVLEVESTIPNERDGKLVGRLRIDEATSKPTLTIGHHLLEGKIATLPKPLAVLRRCSPSCGSSGGTPTVRSNGAEDAMDCDDQPLDRNHDHAAMVGDGGGDKVEADVAGGGGGADAERRWEIVALVKKKILFSKRPMPIVKRQG